MSKLASQSKAIKEWSLEIIGIAGFGGIQWLLTPLIDLDDFIKVNESVLRIISLLLILFLWIGFTIYKRFRQKWDQDSFFEELASGIQNEEILAKAQSSLAMLSKQFEDAIKSKELNKSVLFSVPILKRPWYLMIGPPGSGKTTALLNSGLDFSAGMASIKGISGTRHCNWFFPKDAVVIDTAGRYTSQASDEVLDALEWQSFLHLLLKYRPSTPINGIILMISIAEFLDQTSQERSLLAATLRKRISEVETGLHKSIPVYLILSKADRLAGFTDFFGHLDPNGRNLIWGITSKGTLSDSTDEVIADFEGFLSLQTQMMSREAILLAHHERDLARKTRVIAFPSQVESIKSELKALIASVFGQGGSGSQTFLRGIYISSATQNGTPIDRVMRSFGSRLSLKIPDAPLFSGTGKSFFIKDLFRNIILRESHLVYENSAKLSYRYILKRRIYYSIAFLSISFLSLSIYGYYRSDQEINNTRELFNISGSINESYSQSLLGLRLLTLTRGISLQNKLASQSPWLSFGLFPSDALRSKLDAAQSSILIKDILPLLEQDLIRRLNLPASESPSSFYHSLAAYILLQEKKPPEAQDLTRHLLSVYEPLIRSELSEETIEWSAKLLSNNQSTFFEKNQGLIQKARHQLWNLPQGVLMESLLREFFSDASTYDLKIFNKLGPYAESSFSSRDGSSPTAWIISGLYTESGYNKIYLQQRNNFIDKILKDRYILGEEGRLSLQDAHRLIVNIEETYFNSYAKSWRGLLSNIKIKNIQSRNEAISRLENQLGSGDPIRLLFSLVSDETDLVEPLNEPQTLKPLSQIDIQLTTEDESGSVSIPDTYRIQLRDEFSSYKISQNGFGASKIAVDDFIRDLAVILHNCEANKPVDARMFKTVQNELSELPEPWRVWYGSLVEQLRKILADF